MQNDRQIIISSAGSRTATQWPRQVIYWSELVERLRTPVRGTETIAEYLRLPKSKQDSLKDVGGFVAGSLEGGRRKAGSVTGRDVVTLDLDNIPAGQTQEILKRIDALGCGYVLYSTRKHEEGKPRLRILFALNRTVTADEYEPLSRKLAGIIGMELCDPTTFEASRLMYWPSCCSDSQYVYQYGDRSFIDADGILAMYKDWRDIKEWPEIPGMQQAHVKLAAKQGDPLSKAGIVGAFCKTYDIYRAIDTFLPGVYSACDDNDGRFTFTGGSTVGGAVIYDDGKFLYSHHATDPTGGRLVNAFDLVRLHKYTAMDDDAKPDTPTNKLPSYVAMCQFAVSDSYVAALLNQERYEKATQDFVTPPDTTENMNWISLLQVSPTTGTPLKTIKNARTVLENDPKLKGKIRLNRFSNRITSIGPLPWEGRALPEEFDWTEADDAGLRGYIESILGFRSRDLVLDALVQTASKQSYDPVVTYLQGIEWDGVPRIDTLFIDYLGADDHPYVRAVSRKAFVAAVARAMTPGVKFDVMTVIQGPQGIGKSTLLTKLGRHWFSDSVNTVEGKEAAELLQGVWIIEIGELGAYSKSDVSLVKLFLSRQDDQYRAAYARTTERHPRRCVFFGTTNDLEYLRDSSGNRRFWPISALKQQPTKSIFNDLDDEIDQLWAEAYARWQMGEALYLSQELEVEADKRRALHMEQDPLQGQIERFLEHQVPEDWQSWSHERRMMFYSGMMTGEIRICPRDRICAIEVWRECLRESKLMVPKHEAARINVILEKIPGWERVSSMRFGGEYGTQRGFKHAANTVNFVNKECKHVNNGQNMDVNNVNQKSAIVYTDCLQRKP